MTPPDAPGPSETPETPEASLPEDLEVPRDGPDNPKGVCQLLETHHDGNPWPRPQAHLAIQEFLGVDAETAEGALTRLEKQGHIYPQSTEDDEEEYLLVPSEPKRRLVDPGVVGEEPATRSSRGGRLTGNDTG